ncbi:MAG: anthranilate phosphoribosyltransferase [Patescibacteria group bacterium]
MDTFKNYLSIISKGQQLSFKNALDFQKLILSGQFEESDLIEAFKHFGQRALTYDELLGFYSASAEAMVQVPTERETLDTCGTGGDNSGSFNISTVAALICAATGVFVAKHGNRASSSQCGSADVLEALGVNINLNPEQAMECLETCNFVFLMAKNYHPAFRFASPARKSYGKKTYFNLLGPLLNPCNAQYRIHGFSDPSQLQNLGKILMDSGVKRAWLANSEDGLDEISPSKPTNVWEFCQGTEILTFKINPEDLGFSGLKLSDVKGGDAKVNSGIILGILNNHANEAQTACSLLNAAAGLTVYGKAVNFQEGISIAKEVLASGQALEKLQQIAAFGQNL